VHLFAALVFFACGPKPVRARDAGPPPPPPPDPLLPLLEAATDADPAELERAALKLHEEVLVGAMGDLRREVRYAAVDAAPRGARPWGTFAVLVERLSDRDRETASRAAAALLELTDAFDPRTLAADGMDGSDVAPAVARATKVAGDPRLAADVRVAAIRVVARLEAVAKASALPLVAITEDPDPAVRHAVLESLRAWGPALRPHAAKLEAALRRDDDPRTVLLAAAAICAAAPLPEAVAARARSLLGRGRWSDRQLLEPCLERDLEPAPRRKRR
jgi:hypothetical protein